jgi:hypothetical protein
MGTIAAFLSGILLSFAMITIPVNYIYIKGSIQEFRMVQQTVDNARESGRDIESAATLLKVAEMNQWLASQKYYNHHYFDLWIPDEVDELEYIK